MSLIMYSLMDTRPDYPYEPFYVGIGTRGRPLQHVRAAKSKRKHYNPRVQEVMEQHFALGVVPECKVLVVCPDREYAWLIEKAYIAKLGRKGIDEGGILCNLGAGGEDTGSDLPHVKSAQSAATKRQNALCWSDPEKRAKRIAAMKGKKKTLTPEALEARRNNAKKGQTPEVSAAKGEASRRMWADPEFRAKRSAAKKAEWADPVKRQNMLSNRSAGIAASWTDPEIRRRRINGIRNALVERNVTGDE